MAEDDPTLDLARARTDLAEDRTLLAHERSFAGWVRTGIACAGVGLGLNALFGSLEPYWVPKAIASAFFAISVFIFISAERRSSKVRRYLEPHVVSALRPIRIRLLSWSLVALTVILAIAIWVLPSHR